MKRRKPINTKIVAAMNSILQIRILCFLRISLLKICNLLFNMLDVILKS